MPLLFYRKDNCTGALLSCRAFVPLVAKPWPGCPSTSSTLDATMALPPSGLGTLSEGLCFVHVDVLGLREIWGRTHSICTIYSQLGTNHFKLRNYLVKESLGAVLGDVRWLDLLQQVKERNWSKSCLEIQILIYLHLRRGAAPATPERTPTCLLQGCRKNLLVPTPAEPWWHAHRGHLIKTEGSEAVMGCQLSTTYLSHMPSAHGESWSIDLFWPTVRRGKVHTHGELTWKPAKQH